MGQGWKRERGARPMDAFGLELDGVDLLTGASEEPLDRVVVDLARALGALALEGHTFAEVGLPEAHLELLLRRDGYEVELQVLSLSRPAQRLRGPVRLDLEDLVAAAVACAHELLADVSLAAPSFHPQLRRALSRKVQALETGTARQRPPRALGAPLVFHHHPAKDVAVWLDVEDTQNLLAVFDAEDPGALGTLMCPGAFSLRVGGEVLWQGKGPAFLLALELSRQAVDLVHAVELEEPHFRFAPAGLSPILELDLARGQVNAGRLPERALEPRELARALFEAGEQLAVAIVAHHRAQGRNPWLKELLERCREGMGRLGTAIRPVEDERPARAAPRRKAKERPLPGPGRLRRLRFDRLWEKQVAEDEERGHLLSARRGPLFVSAHTACGLSARGEVLFRHLGSHGVAADGDGYVLLATKPRLLGLPDGHDARWLRNHDGLELGPTLLRRDGLCVLGFDGRGVVAYSEVTGREIWRLLPPRTQRSYVSLQAHRALVATDSGYLYGLDLEDGEVRFRMRSALPFTGPTVQWGRRAVATCGLGDKSMIFATDAHSGKAAWGQELPLGALCRPLVLRNRVFVAGDQERSGALVCLSARGRVLWERPLHLGAAPYVLEAVGRSVLCTAQSGAAMLFSLDGVPEWRLGASGEDLPAPVRPRSARGVLVIPGEVTRAVDPRGGRVLGELRTGVGLSDLSVDSRLNVFALDEDGTLTAYRLTTSLAIVGP